MISVRGLHWLDILAVLWNNQKKTRAAEKFAQKWGLNTEYAVTFKELGNAMARAGGRHVFRRDLMGAISAHLGLKSSEIGPIRGHHLLNVVNYNTINGEAVAEQAIAYLRALGLTDRCVD